MNSATETLQKELKKMDDKLESSLSPLVDGDIINVTKTLDKTQRDTNALFDGQIQANHVSTATRHRTQDICADNQ